MILKLLVTFLASSDITAAFGVHPGGREFLHARDGSNEAAKNSKSGHFQPGLYDAPDTLAATKTISQRDGALPLNIIKTNQTVDEGHVCKSCSLDGTITLKTPKFNLNKPVAQVEGAMSTAAAFVKGIASNIGSDATQAIGFLSSVATGIPAKASAIAGSAETAFAQFKHGFEGFFDPSEQSKRAEPARGALSPRDLTADVVSDFSDASFELDFTGFRGSFMLSSTVNVSHEFAFHLAGASGIPLPGIKVPGMLSFGMVFDPIIVVSLSTSTSVTFDYGFEFSMPDGAGLKLDFLDPTQSSYHGGFERPSFNILPINVTVSSPKTHAFNVSIAFRPTIGIGLDSAEVKFLPFEVMMDLPRFNLEAEFARNVNTHTCQSASAPAADGNRSTQSAGDAGSSVGNAIDLHWNFGFGVGVGADVKVLHAANFDPSTMLYTTDGLFPSSACLPLSVADKVNTATAIATVPTAAAATAKATKFAKVTTLLVIPTFTTTATPTAKAVNTPITPNSVLPCTHTVVSAVLPSHKTCTQRDDAALGTVPTSSAV